MFKGASKDNAYRVLCLFILFVLCVSSIIPNDACMGRSTSLRSRVQNKMEEIVDSFSDMLNSQPQNPERVPPVFDEREGDDNEE